jgi:hypothetical protein
VLLKDKSLDDLTRRSTEAEVNSNQGLMQNWLGNYSRAEQFFAKALEINQKERGLNHPICASTLIERAHVLHLKGQFGEAEKDLVPWKSIAKTSRRVRAFRTRC